MLLSLLRIRVLRFLVLALSIVLISMTRATTQTADKPFVKPDLPAAKFVPGDLLDLGAGRKKLPIATEGGARLFLLGGEPFADELVMWWNFVGRSHEDIVLFRDEWQRESDRFGRIEGYPGQRLPAPPLPGGRLRPRPNPS